MKPVVPCWEWCLSPQYRWSQVGVPQVQQALRELFARWGLPDRIRVDNGVPWGSGADLPAPLALWWLGLGIGVIWNHPYRPTENAKVERQNGTVQRWGEPEQCADWAAWEKKLRWLVRVQGEEYQEGRPLPRLAAHPQLRQRRRDYQMATEASQWELERVIGQLAQGAWPRQVSQRGQISLYGKAYQVGAAVGGQTVWVRLDAATRAWVVEGSEGQELRRHPADQLTVERICQLQVSQPHASSRKPRRRRNLPSLPTPELYVV
jgi:hypothetical protein